MSRPVAWTSEDLALFEWAERVRPRVEALQEALEDLWGNIAAGDSLFLQPETIATAQQNHDELCHPAAAWVRP